MEQSEREKVRRLNCKGEPIYRCHGEQIYTISPLEHRTRSRYPWESENNLPRITKDFFRCKGNPLNPPYVTMQTEDKPTPIHDCEGCSRHGFPIIHGRENIYPVLLDLLNFVQKKTGKRVIITCGHRCPPHNTYSDPSKENLVSKHQVGAEVDFYVQGMEDYPLEVIGVLMQFYQENPAYSKDKDYQEFQRYSKSDVAVQPWLNKEIFIKLYQKNEGRDGDNRHPHPYICLQVRYDKDGRERVLYSWKKAHRGYPKS